MKVKVLPKKIQDHLELVYEKAKPDGHISNYMDWVYKNYTQALPLDIPKKYETSIQNFLRETKFVILVAEDGNTKTLFVGE
ncbi:hypothetical protein GOV13_02615 [Candidatus Pacearchaeota archaeon]|nr:hypothetical protein [Candidatus Pacearchaeota archaeon]